MDPLFERRDLVRKVHLNSKHIQKNIQGSLLAQLKMHFEGRCSSEGFIQAGSLVILGNSLGRSNYRTGGIDYDVRFQADICLPHAGQTFKAMVSLRSKIGIHADCEPLKVLIPRDLHIGNAEFESVKEKEEIEGSEDEANYRGTQYIGKLGVEQRYERELHGITGVQEVEKSAAGRAVRRLASRPATPGQNVVLSIDIKLQNMIEDLYGERRGALVALDPRTGEILAFVSKPTFDPNLFVDGIDSESWKLLSESIDKPLLNRAMRGTYPPGSTYKPFMAMAALETGKRSASEIVNDAGSWTYGGHTFRSHGDAGLGPVDMVKSIVLSSNVYYYSLANTMGVDTIHDFMKPLGFGQLTGVDLPGELRGTLPSTDWKKKTYKKPEQQRWYGGETISLGIGQGYNAFTMLQLASATSTLANGGIYRKPRLVMATQDPIQRVDRAVAGEEPINLGFKPENVAVVHQGLIGVAKEGTAARVFAGTPYQSAGKTGTAQAVTIGQKDKYNASKLDEHQRDHALYMAFAPAENPQIALAIVVENAGFGAAQAAPIARRIFDYWLVGDYPSVQDIEASQKGQASTPIGVRRRKEDIQLAPSEGVVGGVKSR